MGGIIAGAMSGLGEGLVKGAEFIGKSVLQSQAEEAQALRDQTLAALNSKYRRADAEFEQNLRLKPGQEAAAAAKTDIDAARATQNAPVSEDVGGVGPTPRADLPLPAEREAALEAGAYRRKGLISEALNIERSWMEWERLGLERQRNASADEDRDLDRNLRRDELEANRKFREAEFKLRQATEGRLSKGADLDNAVKTIALTNARRVEDLRSEFTSATPERKQAINQEIQVLTGKDNDSFVPVPMKDETGAITGYQIFDKKQGKFIDGASAKAPGGRGPEVGTVVNGFKFKGGDPNSQASWEKVTEAAPAVSSGSAAPAVASKTVQQPAIGSQYIKQTRTGTVIDAPPRSPAASLRGRVFNSKEEAQAALDSLFE